RNAMVNEPDRPEENTEDVSIEDAIIDAALLQYSAVEPLAGLEERVLLRTLAPRRPRIGWWLGLAAAGAAAALLLAAGLGSRSRHTVPPVNTPPERQMQAVLNAAPIVGVPPRFRVGKARVARRAEQFPTPSPLSEAERAVLAFASRHPQEARD